MSTDNIFRKTRIDKEVCPNCSCKHKDAEKFGIYLNLSPEKCFLPSRHTFSSSSDSPVTDVSELCIQELKLPDQSIYLSYSTSEDTFMTPETDYSNQHDTHSSTTPSSYITPSSSTASSSSTTPSHQVNMREQEQEKSDEGSDLYDEAWNDFLKGLPKFDEEDKNDIDGPLYNCQDYSVLDEAYIHTCKGINCKGGYWAHHSGHDWEPVPIEGYTGKELIPIKMILQPKPSPLHAAKFPSAEPDPSPRS